MLAGGDRANFGNRKMRMNSDQIKFSGPNVRHPRCVSYNGKELRVEYAQSNTTILTSIINIMRVPKIVTYIVET